MSSSEDRRPLSRHPGRMAIVAVAVLAVINLVVILLANSETTAPTQKSLPSDVESVRPESGSVVRLQDEVSVDLRDGLTGVLVINGVEIPEDQLERVPAIGIITFRPGVDKEFARWKAGDVAVKVLHWDATKERPDDPGAYSWSFRAS